MKSQPRKQYIIYYKLYYTYTYCQTSGEVKVIRQ